MYAAIDTKNKEDKNVDKLQNFFNQFDTDNINKHKRTEQVKVLQKEMEILKKNYSVYGKFPLHYLKQMKVLVDIKLKGHDIDKLFKKSSLIFQLDQDCGFKVSLIYIEKGQSSKSYEAILSSFYINTKNLLSLQRRKSTKAFVTFGEATFNIFELVNLLNEMFSNTPKP